jgi:membrane associated rhomboid family serine protease
MSLPDSTIVISSYDATPRPAPQHEWDLIETPPKKSSIMDYGYVVEGKAVGCTPQELFEAVRQRGSQISFVWTPETPQPVRPEQVPFLVEVFRSREWNDATNGIWFGVALMALGLVLALISQDWQPLGHNLFFTLGGFLLAVGNWKYWRLPYYTQEDAFSQGSAQRFETWIKKRTLSRYVITVIASLILVSLFGAAAADAVGLAGLVKPAVWRGEIWRLFTAPFMHQDYHHLLLNALGLFYVARVIEQTIKRALFPLLFLACAAVGSVFSVLLSPHTTSLGASGGVMGLLGFVAVAAYYDRINYPSRYVRRALVVMLYFAMLPLGGIKDIDTAAQLGGLVTGLALGWLFVKRKGTQIKGKLLRLAGAAGMLGVISTGAFAIYKLLS